MSSDKVNHSEEAELPIRRSVTELLASEKYNNWSFDASVRRLYCFLVPACLVVCATNGFDSSLLNGLQSGESSERCHHAKR
jgi:hypothetical protein